MTTRTVGPNRFVAAVSAANRLFMYAGPGPSGYNHSAKTYLASACTEPVAWGGEHCSRPLVFASWDLGPCGMPCSALKFRACLRTMMHSPSESAGSC